MNTETEDKDENENSNTEDEMEEVENKEEEDADDDDGMERNYKDAVTSGNDDDTVGVDNNRWKYRRV